MAEMTREGIQEIIRQYKEGRITESYAVEELYNIMEGANELGEEIGYEQGFEEGHDRGYAEGLEEPEEERKKILAEANPEVEA